MCVGSALPPPRPRTHTHTHTHTHTSTTEATRPAVSAVCAPEHQMRTSPKMSLVLDKLQVLPETRRPVTTGNGDTHPKTRTHTHTKHTHARAHTHTQKVTRKYSLIHQEC
eukprot:Gregarina_sp_Pseudo_9__2677@NODE_2924_length_821_cov_4_616368_g2670_i0_p1_GENE_NODE_2924_length_821_cov_4_616368_g2670_i0NODE_2924_length_821_cov_4_616368_g2670_i0_p1_ORF_typecomplete_len110_score43_30UreE_C/PF05194_12/20UreE_C/PF05194_12/0_29_NODE_2924_length_821_cov_4_616368_g2670_i0292621